MGKKQKGFALLELMVALAFLTLIGSIGYIHFVAPTPPSSTVQKKEILPVERKVVITPPSPAPVIEKTTPPPLPTPSQPFPSPPPSVEKKPSTPQSLPPQTQPSPLSRPPSLPVSKPINGLCGIVTNICSAGSLQDVSDTSTEYKWNCLGVYGGAAANCSVLKPPPPPLPTPPPPPPTLPPSATIKILAALLNFQDSPATPFSRDQGESLLFRGQAQKFYQEQSYGRALLEGSVLGWHTLTREGDPGGICMYPTIGENEIQNFIIESGANPAQYQHLMLIYNHPCMTNSSGAGIQQLQIKGVSYNLSQLGVSARKYTELPPVQQPFSWTPFDVMVVHELGHGLGLNHAESWECGVGITFGGDNCKQQGYGNGFDIMGHGSNSLHFNQRIPRSKLRGQRGRNMI